MLCLFEYDQEKHLRDTYEDGFEDGEAHGEKRGIEIGETRLNQLYQLLLTDDRMGDFTRSVKDTDYREQLLKEYHLM